MQLSVTQYLSTHMMCAPFVSPKREPFFERIEANASSFAVDFEAITLIQTSLSTKEIQNGCDFLWKRCLKKIQSDDEFTMLFCALSALIEACLPLSMNEKTLSSVCSFITQTPTSLTKVVKSHCRSWLMKFHDSKVSTPSGWEPLHSVISKDNSPNTLAAFQTHAIVIKVCWSKLLTSAYNELHAKEPLTVLSLAVSCLRLSAFQGQILSVLTPTDLIEPNLYNFIYRGLFLSFGSSAVICLHDEFVKRTNNLKSFDPQKLLQNDLVQSQAMIISALEDSAVKCLRGSSSVINKLIIWLLKRDDMIANRILMVWFRLAIDKWDKVLWRPQILSALVQLLPTIIERVRHHSIGNELDESELVSEIQQMIGEPVQLLKTDQHLIESACERFNIEHEKISVNESVTNDIIEELRNLNKQLQKENEENIKLIENFKQIQEAQHAANLKRKFSMKVEDNVSVKTPTLPNRTSIESKLNDTLTRMNAAFVKIE